MSENVIFHKPPKTTLFRIGWVWGMVFATKDGEEESWIWGLVCSSFILGGEELLMVVPVEEQQEEQQQEAAADPGFPCFPQTTYTLFRIGWVWGMVFASKDGRRNIGFGVWGVLLSSLEVKGCSWMLLWRSSRKSSSKQQQQTQVSNVGNGS